MKIAILGAGAMGSLFGGYLSKQNDVYLIDVNQNLVHSVNENGVRIKEKDGSEMTFHPIAAIDCSDVPMVDLVIIFVKSMVTRSALNANRTLIGTHTFLMTLQNGVGHEKKLLEYTDATHIIIGSTQHNSSIISPGVISHGGSGETSIGLLGGNDTFLQEVASTFSQCGFDCVTSNNIQKQIWNKLFTNTAASSLTAVLQTPLGFIGKDTYANSLMRKLVMEAVNVANALELNFDYGSVVSGVQKVCDEANNGYTSIYADIKNGNRTEVDTISGAVVEIAKELDISVPYHEMLVSIIHAMENKNMMRGQL